MISFLIRERNGDSPCVATLSIDALGYSIVALPFWGTCNNLLHKKKFLNPYIVLGIADCVLFHCVDYCNDANRFQLGFVVKN